MPLTIDTTLTAVGTGLYAPAISEPGELGGEPNWHREPSVALGSLAKRKDDIDRNVLVPILESEDPLRVFSDKWKEYKDWRTAWVSALADQASANDDDLETVMSMQDSQDAHLIGIFIDSQDRLGEAAVQALTGAVSLKKIVRNATMPHSAGWPEESWLRIADLFASSELCMIGVLHHLATNIGRNDNVQKLADWSFDYATEAYDEAGYYGPDESHLPEGK